MSRGSHGTSKLLSAMRKMVREVNDQEICRRLEILMNSEKEDIALPLIRRVLEMPPDFDAREVPEPYTQYVKHYMYMIKRETRDKNKERTVETPAASKETSTDSSAAPPAGAAKKAEPKKAAKSSSSARKSKAK
ncbi:MAG: hypothetical protein HY042_06360 [Spirochaetia bacterium]|nr:hypothetical protein [Spirochaetia bacterium]